MIVSISGQTTIWGPVRYWSTLYDFFFFLRDFIFKKTLFEKLQYLNFTTHFTIRAAEVGGIFKGIGLWRKDGHVLQSLK